MIDMHIHTNNSDGELTVKELVERIIEEEIKLFSITDHDNINSCLEMENIKLPSDTIYIPGIELSGQLKQYNCHILGYNFDYKNINIINECKKIKLRKYKKIKEIIEYIRKKYEIEISKEEEQTILNKQGTFGRMDICKLLIQKGYGTISEIYDKYLTIPNMITHRSKAEIITSIIKEGRGVSILAHPKEIEEDYNVNIEDIIEEFLEIGIDGIEVYNSIHTLKDIKKYLLLAKKYNLLTTAGSDFHGTSKPNRWLGYTTNEHIKIKKNQINFP